MNGPIFTFYSYKGGVGRSMALANVGVHLARRPLNVILVDWDLEAPGLERYLADRYDSMRRPDATAHPGLCDLLRDFQSAVTRPPESDDASPFPDLDRYLQTVDEADGCRLQLLSAGSRMDWAGYARFVQGFDWSDFYQKWSGGALIDWLRAQLAERADVVLVDSRTGITEIGGIATHHLADAIVLPFVPNIESMASSARMAAGFMDRRAEAERGRPLPVIFVPTRIDSQDSLEFSRYQDRLKTTIAPLVPSSLLDGATLSEVTVPYVAAISYREHLVIGDRELEKRFAPLVNAYGAVATNMQRLAPEGSWLARGRRSPQHGRVAVIGDAPQIIDQVREALGAGGFKVVAQRDRSVVTDDLGDVIVGASCVVAVIDDGTDRSRSFRTAIALANKHEIPIVPIVADSRTSLPPALEGIYAQDWSHGEPAALAAIVAAVETLSAPVAERPAHRDPAVFVSYVRRDRHAVDNLIARLRAAGIDVGYDLSILSPGDDFQHRLNQALASAHTMVSVVSPSALESRYWASELALSNRLDKRVVPVHFEPLERDVGHFLGRHTTAALDITTEAGLAVLIDQLRSPPPPSAGVEDESRWA